MTTMIAADEPVARNLPALDPRYQPTAEEGSFWTRGADGKLRFDRCTSCRRFQHPPLPRCPNCGSRSFVPTEVGSAATVWSYTVNYQQWDEGLSVPYVIVIVDFDEGIRFTSNLVGVPLEELRIGLPVHLAMVSVGEFFIPVFERLAHDVS